MMRRVRRCAAPVLAAPVLAAPVLAAVLLAAAGLAGCGSPAADTAASSPVPPAASAPAAAVSLAGSEASAGATWAVLPMGAASGPNEFWQLFLLPAGGTSWALRTPPDIATNGAIAIGGLSGHGLVAGVRPSLYLHFSPVSATTDGGQHWSAGPPAAGLATVPDALAATPGGGALLSLSAAGQVSTAAAGDASWTSLVTGRSLAASAAGRACGLRQLTGVGYAPAGTVLVTASCTSPGVAGIFARAGASWRAAGPALPAALADDELTVARVVGGPLGVTVLLTGSTGTRSLIMAAWLDSRGQWTLSAPLTAAGAVETTAFGADGSVGLTLAAGRGEILSGPAGSWQQTPPLPAGRTVTLALPAGSPPQALAAGPGSLTVWQLAGTSWARMQSLTVPIQYGSSS